MNNLLVNSFEGEMIYTLVYDGKPCWIAIQIASILRYDNPSKTVSQCIKAEKFQKNKEYIVLEGSELRELKAEFTGDIKELLKFAPKLILFYEEGLYGFLQYTQMPVGVNFRTWIRRDVMPKIRERGNYVLGDKNEKKLNLKNSNENDLNFNIFKEQISQKDKLTLETKTLINKIKDSVSNESGFDVDKFQRMRVTLEALKFFKPILDEITDNTLYKFEFLKDICTEAGIALPIYVDGDNLI